MVLSRNKKNIRIFHLKIFIFLVVKFSIYLNMCVFIMAAQDIQNATKEDSDQGLVVQSIDNLKSVLMTNSFNVVAKVFSNTLIVLLQKL